MTDQPRPDSDQDGEPRTVPATVASDDDKVVVVTPDGMGVAPHGPSDDGEREERPINPADLVEQPAKVMRIGSMVKQLLEEVRSAPAQLPGARSGEDELLPAQLDESMHGIEELRGALDLIDDDPSARRDGLDGFLEIARRLMDPKELALVEEIEPESVPVKLTE